MRDGTGRTTRGRKRSRRTATAVATALALLALAPALAGAAPIGDSSAEKQEKLLDLMESFVPRAEAFWCENARLGRFCNGSLVSNDSAGFFDIGPDEGVGQQRGEGAIVYIYATLLKGRPAQASFAGFDREDVIEYHLHQAIRHLAFTHYTWLDDPRTGALEGWGGKPSTHDWQASWGLFSMMYAAQQQWDLLSSTTRNQVKAAVYAQADEITPEFGNWDPQDGSSSDTKAEENAWNAAGAAAGAGLTPGHAHADEWDHAAKALAINSSTLARDDASATLIDGDQLGDWVNGTTNLEEDYTVTNHGFFHPVYSWGTHVSIADAAVIYAGSSLSVPDSFMFRIADVWDNVMARLATDDGDFVLPSGSDWTTHDYGQVPYLSYIATRLQRDDAAVYESRAIDNFGDYYGATMTTARTSADETVGLQADVFRNMALAWWIHELFGPAPDPEQAAYDAARDRYDGAWTFDTQQTAIGRFDDHVASMSWDFYRSRTWPTGLVVPSNASHLDDPAFVMPWKTSAVDGANASVSSYSCDCSHGQDHFSTAAVIGGSRKFSMSAFKDGTTLLLDRGTGATASFGFESIAGFTGSRTIRSDSGTGVTGRLSGDWANVGDRFGLVVKGGSGLWFGAGTPPEQPAWWLRGSLDTGSSHRGAAIFPNASGTTTDALEPDVLQPTVSDANWSALTAIAPNGTGKLAVARWGGGSSATVSGMSSSLGVPIADRPTAVTTVTASTGSASFGSFDDPESRGYEVNFFVTVDAGDTADVTSLPGGQRLLIANGASSTTVTVKYDGGSGAVQTVRRSLAAGEAAQAMVDQGTLRVATIIASSTEPPGTYHPKLAFDFDTTGASNFWVADGATLSSNPQCLTLDFGSGVTANLESLSMTPRRGYGPKDYLVQTGTDRASTTCSATTDWTTQRTITSAGDGTVKNHSWTAVNARYVRIKITAAYGSGPPHYVQIRELVAS